MSVGEGGGKRKARAKRGEASKPGKSGRAETRAKETPIQGRPENDWSKKSKQKRGGKRIRLWIGRKQKGACVIDPLKSGYTQNLTSQIKRGVGIRPPSKTEVNLQGHWPRFKPVVFQSRRERGK